MTKTKTSAIGLRISILLASLLLQACGQPRIGHENRYIDHGDETVTDTETGLMWMRCALGQVWIDDSCKGEAQRYTWLHAMVAAKEHRFAGYDDWRLPDIEELKGLVYCSSGEPRYTGLRHRPNVDFIDIELCEGDYERPTIDQAVFPDTPASFFWSASPYAGNSDYAWVVLFYYGDDNWLNRSNGYRVRLVRGGQ